VTEPRRDKVIAESELQRARRFAKTREPFGEVREYLGRALAAEGLAAAVDNFGRGWQIRDSCREAIYGGRRGFKGSGALRF
jgi:hypothetical protein